MAGLLEAVTGWAGWRYLLYLILLIVAIALWMLAFESETLKTMLAPEREPAAPPATVTATENTVTVDVDLVPDLDLPIADRIRIVIACNNGGGFEFSADNVRSGISFDWPGCAIAEPLQVGRRATFGASAVEEE